MFAVLNKDGIVLAWQLTKGTASENVKDLLNNLKHRFDRQKKDVKLCVTDNCCSWMFQDPFNQPFFNIQG